jgi:hypothetical protein
MQRDESGHRTYTLANRVEWAEEAGTGVDPGYGGPAGALQAEGLPQPGDVWTFPGTTETDPFAYCRMPAAVTPVMDDGEPTTSFDVEQTFSTKPDAGSCRQSQDDPLEQPVSVAISFANYNEEATHDRFGQPIQYSSHELVRGNLNEWPADRMVIKVTANVAAVNLPLLAQMNNTVNDDVVWGFAPRCLKLKINAIDEEFFGACEKYVKLVLEFEPAPDGQTWDKNFRDRGHRVLLGHWHPKAAVWVLDRLPGGCPGAGELPNPFNPAHFIRAKDRQGEPCEMVLNGRGVPYQPDNFSFTFQGTRAQAQAEADAVRGAILGPYATESLAQAACCIGAGTGTGTGDPGGPGSPDQVYVFVGLDQSMVGGSPVQDRANWVAVTDRVDQPAAAWSADTFYGRGSVVALAGTTYIAYADSRDIVPGGTASGSAWVPVTSFDDRGEFNPEDVYAVGDYVAAAENNPFYLYVHTSSSSGTDPLTNDTRWVRVVQPFDEWPPWVGGTHTFYPRGARVSLLFSGHRFVALQGNNNSEPQEDGSNPNWHPFDANLAQRGAWDAGTTYFFGDVVQRVTAGTQPGAGEGDAGTWWCVTGAADAAPGVVHVERFRGSHFQDLPRLPASIFS